jgi:hypothetical protein
LIAATLGPDGVQAHLEAMRLFLLTAIAVLGAGTASAQAVYPGQPYVGDPMADQLRYRMEVQRQRSDEQAAFARQYQLETRLRQMEIETQRRPEPYTPLVDMPRRSPEAARRAREQATSRREAAAAGVSQIDDWLDRTPR